MATQVIGTARRSRRNVAIVAVALTLAIIVLMAQASSLWSSGTVSPVRFPEVGNAQNVVKSRHALPSNCEVKYGCTGTTAGQP
jgi:hypothetical protein